MRWISVGIVALSALALLLAASSTFLFHWTVTGKDEVLRDEVQDLLRVQELGATSQRTAYLLRSYLLSGTESLHDEYAQAHGHFQALLVSAEKYTAHPEAVVLLHDIRRTASHLEGMAHQLIDERRRGTPLEQIARGVEHQLQPHRARLDDALARLIELKQRQLTQAQEETVRSAAAAFRLTWGILLVALVLASSLVWLLTRHARTVRRNSEFERQLMGIVTHDLRSPLSAILLTTHLLARKEGAQDTRAALARIESSARRMESIIQFLLDFTRARLGSGIPVAAVAGDLRDLCHTVVEEARAGTPGRTITEEYEGDLRGDWDAARLAQVLSNLLQNALKYSPEDTPIQVRAVGTGGTVRVHVHNQGAPISRELMPVLFEPLRYGPQTEKTAGSSMGLGLYIVRELVEAHHGRIEVQSTPDTGTTFTVTLLRSQPGRL